MALPEPVPGLVIRYAYLWRGEAADGRVNAPKSRPAVIVLAVRKQENGRVRVVVAPITHRDPGALRGIEIPPPVEAMLNLDGERSWVVTDDLNIFEWPGFDLDQIPDRPGRFSYGQLPARLYRRIRDAILTQEPPVRPVRRD